MGENTGLRQKHSFAKCKVKALEKQIVLHLKAVYSSYIAQMYGG